MTNIPPDDAENKPPGNDDPLAALQRVGVLPAWDAFPLAPGAWGTGSVPDFGGGERVIEFHRWLSGGGYRFTPVNWPAPAGHADGGVRVVYLPAELDLERVERLGLAGPNLFFPDWLALAGRLVRAGHDPAALAATAAPVLLQLLENAERAGDSKPPKRAADRTCRNADRDAWVARRRAAKKQPTWEAIFDELVANAARTSWSVPKDKRALMMAHAAHLRRVRRSGAEG